MNTQNMTQNMTPEQVREFLMGDAKTTRPDEWPRRDNMPLEQRLAMLTQFRRPANRRADALGWRIVE